MFCLHAAFLICGFVRCIWFCLFCVLTVGFVSLYVSKFLTAACGVSPLRGRPKDSALWNPAALERLANFFFLVRVYGTVRFIVLYYPYNISVYLHPQKKTQHCAKVSDFPADITYRMLDGITMPAQQICKSYGGEFYGDQKTVSCSERLPRKFV